jgi:L-aspartate oxidase
MTRLPAPPQHAFDVLIIGSGLAGLTAALLLAPGRRVAVVTKRELNDGSSAWAQGGMAAVLAEGDSVEQHVNDTLIAGAGLCDLPATRAVVEGAPEAITWLRALGVAFSEDSEHPGELHLTREGGHSQRRIVHAADATGAAVQRTLIERVRTTPGITLFEHHMLVDVITDRQLKQPGNHCYGAYVLDTASGEVLTFSAGHTILATGGAGKVYLYSTNPDTATGDGIAAAWRAGCSVGNMEFIQFHPTCLYHPDAKSFLISEAVRGEGGKLLLPASAGGGRFMPAHDARAELAPRDVVARAIDFEMKKHGRGLRLPGHLPPEPGLFARALSQHPEALRRAGHRHHTPAHPGGAGRALHLRRRDDRPGRAHRCDGPLCHRRNRLHRPARRQPPGQQLAGRMCGAGACHGAGD